MKILSLTIRNATLALAAMCLVLSMAWAQEASEEAVPVEEPTGVVEVAAEAPSEPAPVPEPEPEPAPAEEPVAEAEGDEVPASADNMLTMLFVIIVSPIVAGFLRRFNVANSMYQPVNALFSVGLFIAWWYFFGAAESSGLEEWIVRGLAAAGVSGSIMSVAGRKHDVVKEIRAIGTGTGSGKVTKK